MAETKPEHPDLANLREREKVFTEKGKRIETMDANQLLRDGRDINDLKFRNVRSLEEIRKEIARLSK